MNIIFTSPYFSVTDEELNEYESVFPGVNVPQELRRMDMWLRINENRRKKRYSRFIFNWLSKTHRDLLAAEVRGVAIASYKDRQVRKELRAGGMR